MIKLGSFGDSTNGRVKDKLETICLSGRKIEHKRITEVNFRMNKSSGYSTCCGSIDGVANTLEISNMIEARVTHLQSCIASPKHQLLLA